MTESTSLDINEIGEVIRSAKDLAKRYYSLTGRPLGITGEVAEYEAVRLLGLELAEVRQAGYDAIRRIDSRVERIQVKGRCVLTKKPGQRLGKVDIQKEWDSIVLVLLDRDLNPTAIYEAERPLVEEALNGPDRRRAMNAARLV